MHQQLWAYRAEAKIYLWVHERKRLNITVLGCDAVYVGHNVTHITEKC